MMPPGVKNCAWSICLKLLKETGLTDSPMYSPWMSPEETARYLGIALGTLRNWTARIHTFCQTRAHSSIHRDAIDKWLSKGSCSGRTSLADI